MLSDAAGRAIGAYSKGMRQRIKLALAPLLFPLARIVQIAFSGKGFFQASYTLLGEVLDPARVAVSVAGTFHMLVIRSLAFFLILYVFGSILRGDMTDRVLHLDFQTPVRRSLLVAGKYIAAAVTVFGALSCTTVVLYVLSFLPFGGRALVSAAIEQGQGAALLRGIGVLLLACLSCGAMFLLLGAITVLLAASAVFLDVASRITGRMQIDYTKE